MIERIIDWSSRNRFIVLAVYILLTAGGIYCVVDLPVDAIPDLSENQVIVFTEWMGRSPKVVEEQLTYPLASALQGLPDVKAVRASSMFGMSFIFVIFEDGTDIYFARTRVLERLSTVQSQLPEGVRPTLGPDGTGVGHVYWYTVEGDGYDLGTLRAIQDWYVRYQLSSVEGVAEVASVGGYVRQYQIDLNPLQLKAYQMTVADVVRAVQRGNNEMGGKIIESSDAEYFVRGQGYVTSVNDIEHIVLRGGSTPVLMKHVAKVQIGSDIRRGSLEKDGRGQAVGGIIVMRDGENAKAVIDRVKKKIEAIKIGLPSGVHIVPSYDRSDLIQAAVGTLERALIEAAIIVTLMVSLFLLHFRSIVRILIEIPVSVLIAFILMRVFGITSNIMSLGGIILAIGVIVDSSIVMVENAYRHIAQALEEKGELSADEYRRLSIMSAKQVGRAIFYSELIILTSFLPVFLLSGQEGKLFAPLVFTKTFVMVASAGVVITLIPVLMTFLMRGKFRREDANPVTRWSSRLYAPVIRWVLRYRKTTLAINLLALAATVPLIVSTGSEFMPPLDEGSILYMPVTLPNASITEVNRVMQVQDQLIRSLPEVAHVLGKAGRAETATDNAPLSMIETIILLKPKEEWRPGITKDDIIQQLDEKLQIPGVRNGWTQPIINRINMLATGVRTDIGLKIFGNNLDTLETYAIKAERLLRTIPGAADVVAERVQNGYYLDVEIRRAEAARYGVNVGELQTIIEMAVGGDNLGQVYDGRMRFPIRVRYAREDRNDVTEFSNLLVPVSRDMTMQTVSMDAPPSSENRRFVPLSYVADVRVVTGPPMISSENGMLRSLVYMNARGRDMGGVMADAQRLIAERLNLPKGYVYGWSGQYESKMRAQRKLAVILPIVLVLIFFLLYWTLKDGVEALVVMLSVPFALIGGMVMIYMLHYNFSVAVWVGFIALYGIAVETGVVMVVYLHESLDRRLRAVEMGKRSALTASDIVEAATEGAVMRLRPKLMTVGTSMIGLIPIMWATGAGADVMKPLAAPMIGGLITSAIHVLIVTPVLFAIMKERALKAGKLRLSRMAGWMKENENSRSVS